MTEDERKEMRELRKLVAALYADAEELKHCMLWARSRQAKEDALVQIMMLPNKVGEVISKIGTCETEKETLSDMAEEMKDLASRKEDRERAKELIKLAETIEAPEFKHFATDQDRMPFLKDLVDWKMWCRC